jgi:hypothetical protein
MDTANPYGFLQPGVGGGGGGRMVARRRRPGPTPVAFYQANEYKPENLAAAASRLFLGIKLECAQCHDHPFNDYTRDQFWELASFFNGLQPQFQFRNGRPVRVATAPLKIPGTNRVAKPRFPDGKEPTAKKGMNNRQLLAEWMTKGDNPYFARNAVNRLWAHFFGIGLIDPVDEPSDDNPPSHPELLAELTKQFVAHKFDLKFMMRVIAASRAYQLSSVATLSTQDDIRLFARMPVKGLTAEQLFDSLVVATGYRENRALRGRFVGFGQTNPRADFLSKFASQDRRTEAHTSILQALALMNGNFIADATSLTKSETLAGILDFPFFNTPEKKIEALYLAALSRKPRPAELTRLSKYVLTGGSRKKQQAALADIFWALLNSSEFILNH